MQPLRSAVDGLEGVTLEFFDQASRAMQQHGLLLDALGVPATKRFSTRAYLIAEHDFNANPAVANVTTGAVKHGLATDPELP